MNIQYKPKDLLALGLLGLFLVDEKLLICLVIEAGVFTLQISERHAFFPKLLRLDCAILLLSFPFQNGFCKFERVYKLILQPH